MVLPGLRIPTGSPTPIWGFKAREDLGFKAWVFLRVP